MLSKCPQGGVRARAARVLVWERRHQGCARSCAFGLVSWWLTAQTRCVSARVAGALVYALVRGVCRPGCRCPCASLCAGSVSAWVRVPLHAVCRVCVCLGAGAPTRGL